MVNKQDFINSVTQDITMVRGDTLAFSFILSGLGSREEYEALECSFSVVEHYDEDPFISGWVNLEDYNAEKDEAIFTVGVPPYVTKDLELGRYYYDLQFKDTDNVVTLMRGHFTLVYDVSK